MPLTFLSHQAVVLPLKIAAPRATSGTALVLGSMAPDVEYFLRGYPSMTVGHTLMGQLTFCLPVTLVLFWVVTRVIAEPAAARAPEGGELHLPDYGLIRHQPPSARHWVIVGISAVIGSLSHVAMDRGLAAVAGMPYHAMAATRGWIAVNLGVWIVLAAITLLLMRHIGRHRLIRRWADERIGKPPAPADDVRVSQPVVRSAERDVAASRYSGAFWRWVFLGALGGAVLGALVRRPQFFLHEPAVWVHVWLSSVSGAFVGLILASAAWHGARARSIQLRGNQQ